MLRFAANLTRSLKYSKIQPVSIVQRQKPLFYFGSDKEQQSPKTQINQTDSQQRLNIFKQSLLTTGIAVSATHFVSLASYSVGSILLFPFGAYYTYKFLYRLERNHLFEVFEQLRQFNDAKESPNVRKVLDFFEKILIDQFGEVQKLDEQQKKKTLQKLVVSLGVFASILHVSQSLLLILSSGLFFLSAYRLSKNIFKNQEFLNDHLQSLKWAFLKIGLPNYLLNIGLGFACFTFTGDLSYFSPITTLVFSSFWSWGLYRLIIESDLQPPRQQITQSDMINLSLSPFCFITQGIDIFILLNTRSIIYTAIKQNYKELRKLLRI